MFKQESIVLIRFVIVRTFAHKLPSLCHVAACTLSNCVNFVLPFVMLVLWNVQNFKISTVWNVLIFAENALKNAAKCKLYIPLTSRLSCLLVFCILPIFHNKLCSIDKGHVKNRIIPSLSTPKMTNHHEYGESICY
jgi:hypothetical protein